MRMMLEILVMSMSKQPPHLRVRKLLIMMTMKRKRAHLESIEDLEQIESPSTPNLSNDKEICTEAHSFITIPFETLHEPQASVLQCLKEPSYDKFVKDLCTQGHKSRNHLPNKILRSKQVGYLRW
jgi:hypothetical protein